MNLNHYSRLLCALVAFLAGTGGRAAAQQPKAQTAPNSAQQHFQAAQTFQLASDYEKASVEYRASIARALQQLGNLKVSRREWTEGLELLTQAVRMDASYTDVKVDLAIARFESGDFNGANAEIENALERDPRNARALVFAGKSYFLQRNFAKAVERLQMALQVQPDFDIGYVLALANLGLHKPAPAGVIFDEMLASTKPDAGMRVLIGIAYRENGYFEQAALHFAKAIEIDPRKHNVHAALGIARYQQGPEHDGEAREQFLAELSATPGDYTSLYYLGLIAIRQQKTNDAESWLEKAIAAQPESREANFSLGQARLDSGHLNEAVAAFRRSLQLSPAEERSQEAARTHALLGQALARLGRHDESEAELAEMKKLEPETTSSDRSTADAKERRFDLASSTELQGVLRTTDSKPEPLGPKESAYAKSLQDLAGEAFHNLGVIDARASRFASATDEFAQTAKWNPTIEKLDRNWGMAAFRAERYDQAIGPLARELQKNQKDGAIRQMLGLSYYMTDQFGKSADVFRPILHELPDNPGLLYAAGAALVRSGDSSAGRPLLLRMQELGANSAEAHVMIAQAYSDQSHFVEALEELQRAEGLNPKLSDLHFAIGMVYLKQGKLEDAVPEFEKELSVNPGSVSSKYQIAYIRIQQHQVQEAIPLLSDVLTQKPEYGDGHYQMGKALLETGDANAAIQHLEKSVELQPKQPYGYYQLSLAYRRAGRTNDADKALHNFQLLKDKAPKKSGTPDDAS
jgi:tetratricopeptide (TPR) repeat protein